MQTPKHIYRLSSIVGLAAILCGVSCKPLAKDADESDLRTLDNFASADGKDFVVNSCSSGREDLIQRLKKNKVYKSSISVPKTAWADEDWNDVYASLAAIPVGIRTVFFDGLGGKIDIRADSNTSCGAQKSISDNKDGPTAAKSAVYACWFLDTNKVPHIVINSEKIGGHRKWVLHSLVREFGYITAEHLIAWKATRQVAGEKQWYWELKAIPSATETDVAFITELGKTFEEEVKNSSSKYSLARFQNDKALQAELPKWIFAEAFDSYFCSATTEQKFRTDFPKTHATFSKHFDKHLEQLNLIAETPPKKIGIDVIASSALQPALDPLQKGNSNTTSINPLPKATTVVPVVVQPIQQIQPVEQIQPIEVEEPVVDDVVEYAPVEYEPVITTYTQQPEQQVVFEQNSGIRYVQDSRDYQDTGCSFCSTLGDIGRGLLSGGLEAVSLARSFGFGPTAGPQGINPQANCSWQPIGGGTSRTGEPLPLGQGLSLGQQFTGQTGYPNQQTGYPNQQTGYPNQQAGYPNQQAGYPNQQPGYPNQQTGVDQYGNQVNPNSLITNQFAGCSQAQTQAQTQAAADAAAKLERDKLAAQQLAQTQADAAQAQANQSQVKQDYTPPVTPRVTPKAKASSSTCGVIPGSGGAQSPFGIILLLTMAFATLLRKSF